MPNLYFQISSIHNIRLSTLGLSVFPTPFENKFPQHPNSSGTDMTETSGSRPSLWLCGARVGVGVGEGHGGAVFWEGLFSGSACFPHLFSEAVRISTRYLKTSLLGMRRTWKHSSRKGKMKRSLTMGSSCCTKSGPSQVSGEALKHPGAFCSHSALQGFQKSLEAGAQGREAGKACCFSPESGLWSHPSPRP